MTLDDAMATLQSWGTEQNRRMYESHGAGTNVFGVSFANLERLGKRIHRDMDLARELWRTGNADARCLATMVADPAQMTENELDMWVGTISYPVLAELFARNVVSYSSYGQSRMEAWIKDGRDSTEQVGWDLLAIQATHAETLEDDYFLRYLAEIEKGIFRAGNRARHAMNAALIAIGLRNERLRAAAMEAAGRIGHVVVDHGLSGETTPDALAHLRRTPARRK
jgi:3-methyladenine DNA glycosylase AlkD